MEIKRPPTMLEIMRQHYEENLRDEMAKAALIGHLSVGKIDPKLAAELAYRNADAMLKIRKLHTNG